MAAKAAKGPAKGPGKIKTLGSKLFSGRLLGQFKERAQNIKMPVQDPRKLFSGRLLGQFKERAQGIKTPGAISKPGRQGPIGGVVSKVAAKATQGRTGDIVSGVAKRLPGRQGPIGGVVSKVAGRVAKRFPGGAAEAISSLARPLKRKSTRGSSRSSGRR